MGAEFRYAFPTGDAAAIEPASDLCQAALKIIARSTWEEFAPAAQPSKGAAGDQTRYAPLMRVWRLQVSL